uniref:Uncharacterized protein n=1 Tax=Megaselia scalaris TaxID=36166 RepID=T1H1Y6_MEGSC
MYCMGANFRIHYKSKEFSTKLPISEVLIQIRNLAHGSNFRFWEDEFYEDMIVLNILPQMCWPE